MNESAKTRSYRGTKAVTNYKAPTSGLEYIVFEYGGEMKPGSFKTMIESMAKHMAATLKYGGPEASKAIKRAENPVYVEPDVFEREIQDEVFSFESIARFSLKSQSSDQGFQNLSIREQIES